MPAAGPSSAKKASRKHVSQEVIDSGSSAASSERASSVDSDDIDTLPTPKQTPSKVTPKGGERKRSSFACYQPPSGMNVADVSSSFCSSPFEFDALSRKPGVELWAIRLPAEFKPSKLSQMSLKKPTSSEVKGTIRYKGETYVISNAATKDSDNGIGAEMAGMNLVVPHMANSGKLLRAPVKISRRLVLAPSKTDKDVPSTFEAPTKPKREQPEHLLKFRNRAFGFDTPGPSVPTSDGLNDDDSVHDLETPANPSLSPQSAKKHKRGGEKDSRSNGDTKKSKKRKSEAEPSPSKRKKSLRALD